MKQPFSKRKIIQLGKKFGYYFIDSKNPSDIFDVILKYRSLSDKFQNNLENQFLTYVLNNLNNSSAQLFQDLFVSFILKDKTNGFFVEFGATDGITLSNTYLLEKKFHWSGILAEPAKKWHANLNANRNCTIEHKCVWSKSQERLLFLEANDGELSTISSFKNSDKHHVARTQGKEYEVESISLNDLLTSHKAPQYIDYLSIDTEGSELSILENLDFNRYKFNVITVEHNFTENREKIHALITKNGYKRVLEDFSQWDDWYINKLL